jgi:phospholipid-binding lipoprotein MlaA
MPFFKRIVMLLAWSALPFTGFLQADWQSDLVAVQPVDERSAVIMNEQDPYEPFNRKMYAFNMGFHDAIGGPVAHLYLDYVPSPLQTGLSNFFSNLGQPISSLNSFLQGKGQEGLEGIMRFSLNSTLGLFGILDIATPAGLTPEKEDFGQTLSVWGLWDEASFVMLPFLGPYTTRSLFGSVSDSYADPVYHVDDGELRQTPLYVGDAFVSYVKATPLIDELRQQPDPYIFMRESYLQYRTNLIYDGNPPQPALDDFDFN